MFSALDKDNPMSEFVEFLDICVSRPLIVPSAMLGLISLYWLFLVFGFLDVGSVDFDFDLDVDADLDFDANLDADVGVGHGAAGQWSMVALKFMNLGDVPLIVWLSPFMLIFWTTSYVLDRGYAGEDISLWLMAGLLVRNGFIAALLTKFLTNPLRGKFGAREPNTLEDLLGTEVVVKSMEVTEAGGQAEIRTDAAPLYLNVRSLEGTLQKGELACIVDFEHDKGVYIIQAKTEES